MSVTTLMTAEELLQRPDDGMRHELVRGELKSMSPAGFRHFKVVGQIMASLGPYVRDHNLGIAGSGDGGFILFRNPDTVRAPDVAFVRTSRITDERGFFIGTPDLPIEVVSPSDAFSEVEDKVNDYLRAGSPRVIVVDPEKKRAWIYTPAGRRDLTLDDSLDGGDVVPGWTLPLRELFA